MLLLLLSFPLLFPFLLYSFVYILFVQVASLMSVRFSGSLLSAIVCCILLIVIAQKINFDWLIETISVNLFTERSQMAKVSNGVETLPKISIAWVGRTNVTDDRQTDRQTDGRRHIAKKTQKSRLKSRCLPCLFTWLRYILSLNRQIGSGYARNNPTSSVTSLGGPLRVTPSRGWSTP